jgi:hypothetical protein
MKKLTTFLKRISLISTFILLSQTAWSARYSSSAVTQLNNGQTVNPGTSRTPGTPRMILLEPEIMLVKAGI